MPVATRTFRVFISSTFEDLKEERDALQREVFPRLRKTCEEHGARFQAIDLRWGVRDEAAPGRRPRSLTIRFGDGFGCFACLSPVLAGSGRDHAYVIGDKGLTGRKRRGSASALLATY
jgi:hypothetical protein